MNPLPAGTEVDYNLGGVLWLPARVQSSGMDGSLCLRFALGWGTEVVHTLDSLSASRLVAPAGAFTIPLLSGQPVDFLRRMPAAPSFPACEQWLGGAWPRAHALAVGCAPPPPRLRSRPL